MEYRIIYSLHLFKSLFVVNSLQYYGVVFLSAHTVVSIHTYNVYFGSFVCKTLLLKTFSSFLACVSLLLCYISSPDISLSCWDYEMLLCSPAHPFYQTIGINTVYAWTNSSSLALGSLQPVCLIRFACLPECHCSSGPTLIWVAMLYPVGVLPKCK